jgi:hypothetical protein
MDHRAFASPKGLRPRRRVKPGDDGERAVFIRALNDALLNVAPGLFS